jgi:hypothetical protein
MVAANKAGKAALKELLAKLNTEPSRREAWPNFNFTSRILEDLVACRGLVEPRSVGLLSWLQRRVTRGLDEDGSTGRLDQQS